MGGETCRNEVAAPSWLLQLVAAADRSRIEPLEDPYDAAPPPADGSGRRAAVLIAFCESDKTTETTNADGPSVLLTERALGMRQHPGQAAFPGGAAEPTDRDSAATAIREAVEEVSLDPTSVRVLTTLPDRYLPHSDFVVTPVIAWWAEPHPVEVVNSGEVARAVVVEIAALTDPANRFSVRAPRNDVYGPGFEIDGLFIWGFTALLIDHLLRLGGWDRAWDREVIRPLPYRVLW